jgi:class 3 adenylate cyclase
MALRIWGMREEDVRPGLDPVQRPGLRVRRSSPSPDASPQCRPFAGSLPATHERSDGGGARTREPGDLQTELSLLEEALAGSDPAPARAERILTTVLFTDIVDSTARAAAIGDAAWRLLLDRHDAISQSTVCDCRGRFVKGTGDGVLATFGAPVGGLHCAKALRVALSHVGITIRAGVHTGEVERRGDDVAGIGVHIAARVAELAAPGEVLASRTVKDLASGGGYTFTSRGVRRLRGVPEMWELLAVS